MTPEQWKKIINAGEQFFNLPESKRESYLKQLNADHPETATQFSSILALHPETGDFSSQAKSAPRGSELTGNYDSAGSDASAYERIGRYHIDRELGRGGMGVVYRGRDPELNRFLAVKIAKQGSQHDGELCHRFLAEAQIMGRLQHPGVAPIHELGKLADGRPYFSMKQIQGQTLAEMLKNRASGVASAPREMAPGEKRAPADNVSAVHAAPTKLGAPANLGALTRPRSPVDLRKFLHIFEQICQTLAYAHSQGIVHRDLKPQNVMVGEFGEVQVLDWGLAKQIGNRESGVGNRESAREAGAASDEPLPLTGSEVLTPDSRLPTPDSLTKAGVAMGTPAYMAPEQAAGEVGNIGPHTDIYGLGAILFQILTGRPPFTGANADKILEKVGQADPDRPRQLASGIPRELEAICLKALAKEPTQRYASASDFAKDVQRYLTDEPVHAYPDPLTTRVARWGRRHRAIVAGAAALLITAVVALTISTILVGQQMAVAQSNYETAERQKNRAEGNFDLAVKSVDEFFTKVSQGRLLNEPGMKPLRKELLETARAFYTEFVNKRRDDPETQIELGNALLRLARITNEMGEESEAAKLANEGQQLFRSLADNRDDFRQRAGLAESLILFGELHNAKGRTKEAEAAFVEARDLQQQLTEEQPSQAGYADSLVLVRLHMGRLYIRSGRLPKAESEWSEALSVAQQLVQDHPGNRSYQSRLSSCYNAVAAVHFYTGQFQKSEAAYKNSINVLKNLHEKYPQSIQYADHLANRYSNLGLVYNKTGEHDKGKQAQQDAIDIQNELVRHHPGVPVFRFDLSRSYMALGALHWFTKDYQKSARAHEKAIGIREKLVREHPNVMKYAVNLARNLQNIGITYHDQRLLKKAEEAYLKAADMQEKLMRKHPDTPQLLRDLGGTRNSLLFYYRDIGRMDKAEESCRAAVKLHEELVEKQPTTVKFAYGLGQSLGNLANVLRQTGKAKDALKECGRAIGTLKEVLKTSPDFAEAKPTLADNHWTRAWALEQLGRNDDALKEWCRALVEVGDSRRLQFELGRQGALAAMGEYTYAVKEAEAAVKQAPENGAVLYFAAMVYSISAQTLDKNSKLPAKERKQEVTRYITRGFGLLTETKNVKNFSVDLFELKNNPRFAALRKHPDFVRALKDLESAE